MLLHFNPSALYNVFLFDLLSKIFCIKIEAIIDNNIRMADNGKYCIGITYIDRMIEIGLSVFNSILFLLVVKLIIDPDKLFFCKI